MENKQKKGKLWHRIKYRNSVAPSAPVASDSLRQFAIELKRRHHLMLYINKVVKKTKSEERSVKVAPLYDIVSSDNDIREFCRKCPTTAMSRFQEKSILKKIEARGLELRYPDLVTNIMSEAKEEFLKVTQQAGMEMKLKEVEKEFKVGPYKHLGRTANYSIFLQRRKELKNKFILHHPLIRRILNECVTKLPHELFNLNSCLKNQLDMNEFQKHIFDYVNDAAQRLQEFYRKIVGLVEREKINAQHARSYLGACTGLLSVNISRTIAHTLLHVVTFTGSKEHTPYLKLNITFKYCLILQPTAEDIIEIYNKFLRKIIDSSKQFYVLEKYKLKGFENKQIHLCLTDEFYDSILKQIAVNINEKYAPILEYIKNLDNEFVDIYGDLCTGVNTISISDLIFEDGCKKLLYFKSYLPKVAFIPDNAYFTIGQLIITEYREVLKQTLLDIIDKIFGNLSAQHEWENNDICEAFDIIYVRATQKPITTEEVIEIGKYMAWVRTKYLDELKERVIKALAYLTKLIQLGPLKENHIIINAKAINWLDEILPILEENSLTYEQLKFEAEEKLQRVIEDINVDIKDVYPLLDILDSMDNIENVRNYLNTITLHMVKIKNIESKIEWINKEEVSLSFPKSNYSEFEELKNYVYPFYHLLKLCLDVQRNLSVWLDGQFDLINYGKVKETVEKYNKELLKTQKVYRNKLRQAQDENLSLRFKGTVDDPDMLNWPAPLKLCSKAIKLIQDFEPSLAVIKIMCNEALMKRHWQKMSKVAGFDITPNAGTTLRKIIQIDLKPDIDKYESISFSATQERQLLENLEQMLQEWTAVNFNITDHKEIKIITELEDIEIVADDHTIKVINMLNSIYVKPYDIQVKDFYNKLLKISKTINECKQVQQQWLHFLPLFLSNEITIQMIAEAELFKQVTNTYNNYIQMIQTQPNVYTTVNNTTILQDLINCSQQLELVNRGVNSYFDKIRKFFPRFYFVSNEEMFRILSVTKDPTQINKFIQSLFYEIKNLNFNENYSILGIISNFGEMFNFVQSVDTRKFQGCVELWLKEVETEIVQSLRYMIQEAVQNYQHPKWFLQWPSQIVLTLARIIFTLNATESIKENTLPNYKKKYSQEIENIVNIINSSETDNDKKSTLNSLLVLMIYNKDTLFKLLDNHAPTDQNFHWISKLRYYLNDNNKCSVKIFDSEIQYGYEYYENKKPFIITPETERCYHTLILAYKFYLCANLEGLAGNGKTDTIKNLAKALAISCTFFQCSKSVNFEVILEFLKGIAWSGSWLILEHIDKVQTEVCSVLSHTIDKLLTALKNNSKDVVLNSTEIQIQRCFICCTSKKTDNFPQSFRVLFRPIVMAIPDYQLIAQILLFSLGCYQWKELGKKLVTVLMLMKDLLPQFKPVLGISTIKKILNNYNQNKTSNNERDIYNSICQVIRPKLTSTEMLVFEAISLQFFPSCQSPHLELKLEQDIDVVCKKLKLNSTQCFISKVTEIYEILQTKKGLFITGETYSGKSTALSVLTQIINDRTINLRNISPNTLTFEQLFGDTDSNTLHWIDGIVTKYLREESTNEDWIILDGAADLSWMDELNPLLNDTYSLCLSSGEILRLKSNKRIIFELDTLNQVSPSMISRCGIIYMNCNTIGWKSLLTSWLSRTTFDWKRGFEENFILLFDWIIPACFDFIKVNCQQIYQVNQFALVKSTIQILEMFMVEAYESIIRKEEDPKNLLSWIQASFVQSIIWSFNSILNLDSRLKFDEFFKQLWRGQNRHYPYPKSLDKVEVSVPAEELIFDYSYLYKSKGNWKYWPDVLKNEKIEESNYLADIYIPTNETIKYATLINMHINHGYPLLLAGPSGTGKTLCMLNILMNKLNKKLYEPNFITFTSKTTANQTQKIVLSKLFKQKSGRYSASAGKQCILYIDDFNEPKTDKYGTQPSLDLIRELLDRKKWYHLETFKPLHIDNINVLTTVTTSNSKQTCQRILRHFNVFCITELPEDSILRIFSNILLTKWKKIGFPSDILSTINQIVSATYHFYQNVSNLTPSLNWNFYFFNMKNFSKIIQVCSLIRKESADSNKKLFFKLWTHEIIRVLGDKILEKDKIWIFDNIKFCIENHFKEDFNHLFDNLSKNDNNEPDLSKLMFGTYTDKSSGRFDETDCEKLLEISTACLKEYKMDLVLFEHALECLSKVCRVISIPHCNLVQMGMCGTGRQVIVKLACLIYEQKFFKLKLKQNYKKENWHAAIKSFLKEAGGHGRPCTFFLKEEEIVLDLILEDLEYLLKTGQIPFLYSLEETQEILDLVRNSIQEPGKYINIAGDSESILLYHQKRCKENLHMIMSFNPLNCNFKQTLKKCSSLRNHCEINYEKNWPKESFENVAKVWTEQLDIHQEIKTNIIPIFSYFHSEAEKISDCVPITIGSFLAFVRLYVSLVSFKQKKITTIKEKYLAALEKLSFAAYQISEMQKSLADYQPQLEAMTEQAIEMAKQIETETIEVEKASDLVKKDEEVANEQAAAAQVLKLDCEADLAQAIPILEDAISALNTLKPTDITLVKSMKNPPDAIKLVMAAVCVIKDVKPDRIPDPSTGRKTIDYWGPSKRILGDMNFLQTLKDFDKDNIKPEIMVKIRKDYLPHKDFKPHIVAKASSAAEGLCKWIIAMDMYDKVAKEVAPKKEKLEKAEREYGVTMAILNEKKEQVSRIEQKLADLNAMLKEATRKQKKLQKDVDICKRKLNRAQKLIGGLSEEKIRWTNAAEQLEVQYNRLPGDILLSSAFVAYLGPFRRNNRSKTFTTWFDFISDKNIPYNKNYNFLEAFEKDVDYDKWHLSGLPTDNFFVENGVIAKFSKRWSLFIDPQNQANIWIKLCEKQNGIKITKFSCPDYIRILKDCITSGKPLLLENVGESMHPFLTNLISKNTFFQNEIEFLDLGGDVINYNTNFVLYMTTNLKYPNYSPKLYDTVTIIDFRMNKESLHDQLLTCVVEIEKPTLKKIKKNLNVQRKRNKDLLYNIEEKILKTLSESEADILEDEHALQILDESKMLSKEIQQKQETLKETEVTLNNFRANYESVAKHSTSLYFTVYHLTKVNHMYQFSYSWFVETFSESIQKAHKYKDLLLRRKSLIDTFTFEIYCKVCRGIFEKDKLFFSFLLCTNLMMSENKISAEEMQFFTNSTNRNKENSKCPDWLPTENWKNICGLRKIPTYETFSEYVIEHEEDFRKIFISSTPEREDFLEKFTNFKKLLIIKLLRPDRLYVSIRNFIGKELGAQFTQPPLFDISYSFNESYILSPLMFILKPETDPINSLMDFAKAKNFQNKLILLSFKSGQEKEIEPLINRAQELGLWICLQNCHLLSSWLSILDLKVEDIDYSNTHENFRLWLTTDESTSIPISLLERCVKMTKESPTGLRNKMLNLFSNNPINSSFYTSCPRKHEMFVRLLYSTAFLYCSLQERNNFKSYAWDNPYSFIENDFLISVYELQNIVSVRDDPFDEIVYLMEKCTYGGYIVNQWDRRLFNVIVKDYLNPAVLKNNSEIFINTHNYGIPLKTDHLDCINHIIKMSENDSCQIFGLNENYESIRGHYQTQPIFDLFRLTCNDIFYTEQETNIYELITDLLSKLPEDFEQPVGKSTDDFIINLIIFQEIEIHSQKLKSIKTSLTNLQKCIKSTFAITDELEQIYFSIKENQTPPSWLKDSSKNFQCLSSFIAFFNLKVDYFKSFKYSPSQSIWLASFFNPKAFLTAVKLRFNRNKPLLLDKYFSLTNIGNSFDFVDRISISDIYLTGASWNEKRGCIEELPPKLIHCKIPSALFVFTESEEKVTSYECPLYKCISLGNSSNFILPILIKTDRCVEHWIRRKASMLTQL